MLGYNSEGKLEVVTPFKQDVCTYCRHVDGHSPVCPLESLEIMARKEMSKGAS